MTVEEIKAALKQMRIELAMLNDVDDESPEIEDAWHGVHDAIIALMKYEKKAALKNDDACADYGKVKPDE